MAHDEPNKVRRVAVIGAGAAGLVAARELNREGHELVVFEQADHVGGTWVYDPQVETDPLGLDPARTVIHSSIYLSLRTNLPREVMGFRDYPFKVVEGRDCRRLPGHKEVALYLQDFAAEFRLLNFIRFRTKVEYVGRDPNNQNQWIVRSNAEKRDVIEELYDAVVVCSGHHTQPRVAEIPGIDKWPGKQIHSHNYRVPAPFQDQVVIVIGNSASGEDISRELASVAKEVHVSDRSITSEVIMRENLAGPGNISLHPMIEYVCEDGTVMFRDGYSIVADTIIHCTGYSYHFPFLETEGIVTMNDNCVGPLYEHVFPPVLAPSLSFVGLPWQVAPLSVCELQSRWIAKTLSGKAHLPSENDMIEAVRNLYAQNEASGRPKHYTHNIGHCQSEYVNWLADQCGCAHVEDWWENIYALTFKYRASHPQTYRDEWEYHYWLEIALKGLSNGIDKWPGKQIHSHNYRVPAPFQDQVVIVIGNAASGEDISKELMSVAKEVHLSARSITSEVIMREQLAGPGNLSLHPMIEYVCEDGTVRFQDGLSIIADTIIHCTGYYYHFPFLKTEGIVSVNDNCVGPLYQHVFPPVLAPSLSFVGLPWKVVPFPLCELQSRWIAKTLSRKAHLPSKHDMIEAVRNFYVQNEAAGRPKHYTHNIGHCQFEYDDWLADQCGCAHVEDWRKNIYAASGKNKVSHPRTYRDEWEDHYWLEIALLDLSKRAY